MIVNHLKSQGLFDQFRRDCLADVDTKPAYQNLRQRVDNFVANHLATHTWSPHLNKNQLRNNIRQQVLKSGMLESGIDRIISQVVDPKINHTFRPQVEKAVHEFLATLNHREEASSSTGPEEEKPDSSVATPGVPAPGPSANVASDAMSILETITSLNQEATAARASTETPSTKASERGSRKPPPQPGSDTSAEKERASEGTADKDKCAPDSAGEGQETAHKSEEVNELPCPGEEIKNHAKENSSSVVLNKDVQQESTDQKNKSDKAEKKPDSSEKGERKKEKKEKTEKKFDHSKRSEDAQKVKDEKQAKDKEVECTKLPSEKSSNKAKTTEGSKEDCSGIDSDVDGLTDITVSSVHTSDLSSFEEDTEEEVVMSDSMEEGEITSDDEEKNKQNKTKTQPCEPSEGKARSVRHAYVHKPYLYSKYYSDSDDELTVEQRRQSIAKEKEERLLRRQINREKLEEKRKQKAEKTKSSKVKSQGKNSVDLEESSTKSLEQPKAPRIKEVLKERKVLEKKVALSKRRRKDSRNVEESSKKKQQAEEDSKETLKTSEHCEKEKVSSSKDLKHAHTKSEANKPTRRLSECLHAADENKTEPKLEREHKRRTSTPVVVEGAQEEADTRDGKRQTERSDTVTEEKEPQKQKSTLKNEKHLKKDDSETAHVKNFPKKEMKSSKEKPEKEKTASEDKLSTKHKHKGDSVHKTGDEAELHSSEKGLKVEESVQKQSQQPKLSLDDKAERKSKHRNERKLSILGRDGKPVSEYIIKTDENVRKETKKERHLSTDKTKAEHRSRRSSDSKIQKDSLSSKQHGTTLQRRSESYSEDKCDTDSTNLDSNAKPEEVVHKEKRRTKSLLEEKLVSRSKSKSQSKQSKVIETELQEGVTKQTTTSKPDKEKNSEENDPDRQRKSKAEDKSEEAGAEAALENAAPSAHSAQKDAGHRAKLPVVKDRCKGERESGSSRLERKLSDGHKSRSSKHSSKDMKKKEENKPDDKDGKEVDSSHEKAKGNGSVTEKKLSRRVCESRKGSASQEMTKGEEKLAANTSSSLSISSLQRPKRGGDTTLTPEQEPMETESEPAGENVPEVSKSHESSSDSSQPVTDSENVVKRRTTAMVLKDEVRSSTMDAKTAAPACKSGRGAGAAGNADKHTDHKSTVTKKVHVQSPAPKPSPRERTPTQQGPQEPSADPEASHRTLPCAPSESDRAQKNVKHTRPPEEHVAHGDAVPEHSSSFDPSSPLSSAAVVPPKQPHDADVTPAMDQPVLEGGTSSTCLGGRSDPPNQSVTVKESRVPRASHSKEGGASSTADTPAKASLDGKRHIPEVSQATFLHSKQGKGSVPPDSKLTDTIGGSETVDKGGGLVDMAKKGSDLSREPAPKQTDRTAVANGQKDGIAVDHDAGMSSSKDAKAVEHKHSGGSGEGERGPADVERRKENGEVDARAGGNPTFSVSHQRNRKAEDVTASSGRAEKTSFASSTEGRDEGIPLNLVKATDATATSSERGEEVTTVPCASIEADEGLTGSPGNAAGHTGAEARHCTVLAAAEEGGPVVTEGLAGRETFLTSSKEGESGECTLAGSEERAAGPVTAQAVAVKGSAGSAVTEEKDDAVTSAGSEGKCDGSSNRDSERLRGAVSFTGEGESDGAVTSAGTEMRGESSSVEEVDRFQASVMRKGPKKETEGTVTCTGTAGGRGSFVVCRVTGAGPQQERTITGAAVILAGNDTVPGSNATQEGDGSGNDSAEGESAVTSTGITEDDAEGPASCTGVEESGEGFAMSSESEETGPSAMDSSSVAKEVPDAPLVAASPCDDEGIVTSTGAKEEDEEGEGVVTSTGRGNEAGHTSAGPGLEEESEEAPVCESAQEGDGDFAAAAGHRAADAGAGAGNAQEGNVHSVSSADKETKDAEICSSAKGIVESSVTSAASGKGGVAPVPEGREGPMTSAASGQRDSLLASHDKVEATAISTGLVGSYEDLVSGAGPDSEAPHTSPGEKEDESVITSVENEGCAGLMATTASDNTTNQPCSAGSQGHSAGLVISTSTTRDCTSQLSTIRDAAGHPSAPRAEERVEGPSACAEFEAPMPSAGSGEEKDECALISTSSVGEECEVPVSSATTVLGAGGQQSAAAVEKAEGSVLVSTDDFEVPMPSAPAEVASALASTSKEEKDECALISTSIAEECEVSVSRAAADRGSQQSGAVVEEKDGSAVISTSSGEDCEGPVSSAVPPEQGCPSAAAREELSDTATISTSTSEEREAVMRGTIPAGEERPEDLSDAAVISTSTAECVPTVPGLDRQEEDPPTAGHPEGRGNLSAAVESRCEVPEPRLTAKNTCECPRPLAGGVRAEEGRVGAQAHAQSAEGCPLTEEKSVSLGSVESQGESPGPGTAEDSTTAPCSAVRDPNRGANSPVHLRTPEPASGQGAEDTSISICSLMAANPGAKMAEDGPPVRGSVAEQASLRPAQGEPAGNLQATAGHIHGQGSELAPSVSVLAADCESLPAAECEQDLAVKRDRSGTHVVQASAERTGDGTAKSFQKEGDLGVTVSSEENLGDKGNEDAPSNTVGELDLKANLKTERPLPAEEEKSPGLAAPSESAPGGEPAGVAELRREPSLLNKPPEAENSGSRTNEEALSISSNKEDISTGRKDDTEAVRGHSVEANSKEVEEKERHMPKRKRKKHYPSSEDELDDNSDALDSKIETAQRQRSETEPQDTKEESSGDLEGPSKPSPTASSAASRAMEERDEYSSTEAAGEKTEQNDDDNVKTQEEDQPVIIKRKRGRPRKHPVETALKTKEDCKTDTGIVTVEQSPPGGKPKVAQTEESSKETGALQERSISNDDGEEKTVASVRRRGRKPKRSLTLSDDAESSEPERKRQKSISEATEDKKDQESEEEEEEEEEDEPSGATTRSAARSEAQRSKAQLSPSTKRKREASPPGARTRGQQRAEDAPGKKAKRSS